MKNPRLNQLKELAAGGDQNAAADLFKEFPDAFLWDNNGTYWARISVADRDPNMKPNRVAVSLKTHDLNAARRKRNEVFAALT